MALKYCLNCQRRVKPRKDFSVVKFLLLFVLTGGIGAGIYIFVYWGKKKRCPICGDTNWGRMAKTRREAATMALSGGITKSTDFELKGHSTAEGRGYVVQRSQDRQRLAYWSLPVSQGLYAFNVAGTSYRRKALQDPAFSAGKRLAIIPEPTNPADPEALAVWDNAHKRHIGYVPKDCPTAMRRRMREERGYTYLSMWENRKGKVRVGLRVLAIKSDVRIRLPNK